MPIPFAADLLWAFSAQSLVLNNNDPVIQWPDLSGANRHLNAPAEANRPTYIASGSNGRPVVRFTGSPVYMKTEQDAATRVARPTVFMLSSHQNPTGANSTLLSVPNADGAHTTPFFRWGFFSGNSATNPIVSRRWNGTAGNGSARTPTWWGEMALWRFLNGALRRDGCSLVPSNTANVTYTTNDALFVAANGNGGEVAQMDVWGILVYNRALLSAEATEVQDYIRDEWAVPPVGFVPSVASTTPAPPFEVGQAGVILTGSNFQ